MLKIDTDGIKVVKWVNGKRYVVADVLGDSKADVTGGITRDTDGNIIGTGIEGLSSNDILVAHSSFFTADANLGIVDSTNTIKWA